MPGRSVEWPVDLGKGSRIGDCVASHQSTNAARARLSGPEGICPEQAAGPLARPLQQLCEPGHFGRAAAMPLLTLPDDAWSLPLV